MIIQRILMLLEEKSLTATDLCHAIGINTSTMTNWKIEEQIHPQN